MSLKQFTVAAVLAFASVASAGLQPPPQDPARGSDKVRGCYASKGELTLLTLEDANSRGVCNEACRAKNKNVAATSLDDCFCGDKYPPKSTKVDDDKCGEPCPGYGLEACGGLDTFSVYNTGVRVSVGESEDTSSSSSSARPSTTSAAPPGTSSTTPTDDPAATQSADGDGKKSNTVGIAVGVVCGFLAVAGVGGAAFFFFRRRRNSEIEEEHRRNAAVNAFISGGKPPSSSGGMSMSDSRLDPVLVNRRMSDGSIADNQDYSRRILRVTNA